MDHVPDDTLKLAQALLPAPRHEQFLRSLDDAKKKAATTIDVEATPYVQAGQEILVATCPVCTLIAGLSGEGRHQCRSCHTWLRFHRKS